MPTTQTNLFQPPLRGSDLPTPIQKYLLTLQMLLPLNLVDTSGGSYAEALPPAGLNSTTGQSNQNQEIIYLKASSDANVYSVTGAASGTETLTNEFDFVRFKSNGTNWYRSGRTAPASGGGGIQTMIVTLTAVQLMALRATPVTLVAAQAGKTIVPLYMQLIYNFGTIAYSGAAGNIFQMLLGTDIAQAWDTGVPATGFVDQGSSRIGFSSLNPPFAQNPVPEPLATFQGEPLTLGFGANQGVAPLSAGDGTVTATVGYVVL